MKILVYGTTQFDSYDTFLRGLIVAIEENIVSGDNRIEVLTAGPHKINNFTAEFINKTEGYFKQKKIKTKFSRVRYNDMIDKLVDLGINHVISFNSKTDPDRFFDSIISKAEENKIKTSYYKY
jgi:hypothetical protein